MEHKSETNKFDGSKNCNYLSDCYMLCACREETFAENAFSHTRSNTVAYCAGLLADIMRMVYKRQYHESSVREEVILTASSVRANSGGMPIAMVTSIARM